jgi:hypothetical protein
VRRALAILIGVVAAAALAACGDDPKPVEGPVAASDFSDPAAGIAFRAPAGARPGDGKEQQVVVLRRGQSTLVVSRFERNERLPNSRREFERAAKALTGEYAKPGNEDLSADTAQVADRDAVVVRLVHDGKTTEHVHFYEYGAEVVVDMVAPTVDVAKARVTLFDPVLTSLKITKPQD